VGVPAVDKAVEVLRTLASSDDPMPLSRLAAQLALPKSSLHNVCTSLVEAGLLEKDEAGRYSLGMFVVELARQRLGRMDVVGNFLKICGDLALNEAIVLSVLNGPDVVYVACVNADRPLGVRYQIGMRLPAAFTASGKAMLATRSDDMVRDLLGPAVDSLVHPGTRKSTDVLLDELHETRERQYSIDDEETAIGMICLGAPVFQGRVGDCCGAIAISMVKSAVYPLPTHIAAEVRHLAKRLSESLGYTGGWPVPSR